MKETDTNRQNNPAGQPPQNTLPLPHLLLDQLPVGVFHKDKDGRYVFVNSWLCRLKEATLEEFIGKTANEFAARKWKGEVAQQPDNAREINVFKEGENHHKLIVETGRPIEVEEFHVSSDGREQFFHVIKGPLLDPSGTIVGSQGLLLDITARKRAEAQLAVEGGMLRALMSTSTDMVYFKDRESRFTRCSAALAAAFGLGNSEEAIGKRDFDFHGQEHAQQAFDDEQEIIRTGRPVIGKTEKEMWPDGHVTWALTSKMPLHDEHGGIVGTFGISKDITSLKATESKIEELHKQLLQTSRQAGMAEVATSVLHNVGNVLNSANVSVMLLLDKAKKSKVEYLGKAVALLLEHEADLGHYVSNDPKGKQLPAYLSQVSEQLNKEQQAAVAELDSLRQNIEHIKEIVTMQQSYAKVSGVAEIIKPADLVEDALRMNAGGLARHGVELVREFSEAPALNIDKHKALQILVNLIRNAKYACDESQRKDKQIKLRISRREQWVCISVIDNGIGIPPENQTRIFNHGFTTRQDGHGFGLHSGALAAKELGGTLTVHSDGTGHGAAFTLELPAQPLA